MAHPDIARRRHPYRALVVCALVVWAAVVAMLFAYLDRRPPQAIPLALVQTSAPKPTDHGIGGTTPVRTPQTAQDTPTTAALQSPSPPVSALPSQPRPLPTAAPPLVVAAAGDVLGDRRVGDFIDREGGEAVFANVRPVLETAHLAFVNVEGPISDKGARATWKEYTFRARPALIDGLVSAGIDMVSLANNHSVDYGSAALLDTLHRLDQAGICSAGAGANASAAASPALLVSPAGTVALLAYTDIIPGGFAATSKTPGVNTTTPDHKRLLAAVKAVAKTVDFLIVSFHWGTEYKFTPDDTQRQLAHEVIDAGADLVLGHHPHVMQGLEIYQDRLIAYSLGDFVWDHYSRDTGETFILRVALTPEHAPAAEIFPVYLDETTGVPAVVHGEAAARILQRLYQESADLGVQLTLAEDRAWLGQAALALADE